MAEKINGILHTNRYEIRPILPDEYGTVENVVREAFWNVYAPGCEDHYMVHIMRGLDVYVPELELAALNQGKIVGAVINIRSRIVGDDGIEHEVLSLGPIGVLPDHQGKDVGSALLAAVKEKAREMGFRAILLCGNHDFYGKNGFERAETYRIRDEENCYVDALHVCGLYESAAEGLAGRYYENEVYQVDQAAAEEFDRGFLPKEKISGNESQMAFLEEVKKRRQASLRT